MTGTVSAVQKYTGLAAAMAALVIIITPLLTGVEGVLQNRQLLTDQQNTATALSVRLEESLAHLSEQQVPFKMNIAESDPESVSEAVQSQCQSLAQVFSAQAAPAGCNVTTASLGGDLVLHQAVLSASGETSDLFSALDANSSEPHYFFTRVEISARPDETTSLSLHLASLSEALPGDVAE